jgi:hypothetical protein
MLDALAIAAGVLGTILGAVALFHQNRLQGRVLELEEARERDRLTQQQQANLVAQMVKLDRSGRLIIG